ncbi:MAG: coiled-coil domain-containing protein, partial [Promethearchaeota archaeon]
RDVSCFSKIRALQKEAKQLQGEISRSKKELNEISLKFNEIKPVFDAIKKDHDALKHVIQKDLENITELKKEMAKLLKNKNISDFSAETLNAIKNIRNKTVIEEEIKEITLTIERIKKNYLETILSPIAGIIHLKNQLLELNTSILEEIKEKKEIWNVSQINKKFEAFKEIESFMKNIEKSCNQFLSSINLSVIIQLEINDSLDELFLRFVFNRNDKENLIFQELTKPEKIFFIISFYIAVHLNADIHPIIFSNLFLPPIFNKKGSIFRTIKKIVPFIQKDIELKIHEFLFIISNLPLKEPIEGVDIINI